MTEIYLFSACFLVVFFLGLQSLNVNGRHWILAALTSFGIGAANLYLFKTIPGPTDAAQILAYLLGGPFGIVTAMWFHPRMARRLGQGPGRSQAERIAALEEAMASLTAAGGEDQT